MKEFYKVRNRFLIAPLLAFACTLSAWAQTQKIAVIDMQSALLGTKDGQKAAAELKAKFAPKELELQKKQQEMQAKTDQLRKTENTISDEAKLALQNEIAALQRNLQRDSQDAQQDLQEEQQRILGDLSQKMNQVMGKYAQEKQLTMIFDVSGQPNNVLFASSTIDITRDIIALYDSAAPVTPSAKPSAAPSSSAAPATPKKATTPPPATH